MSQTISTIYATVVAFLNFESSTYLREELGIMVWQDFMFGCGQVCWTI